MTDFFDLPGDAFVKKTNSSEKKTDPNIYNPDPNAHNGSYKSVFRFLPYVHDKSQSKYTKYSAKFYNPLTKETLWVDCPSNEGKSSILWDREKVIRSIKEEEPELHRELDSSFSRWHSHFSPIYVKKDPQRPELEGSVKWFKFSSQINTLIEAQISPEEDELIESSKSVNPYHLLQGKDFLCAVGKKTKTFRDWSKSKFMEDVTPFIFKIGDKSVIVENNEKSVKLVQEFLKKNTPLIDDYLHKPWTEETYHKVAEYTISVISNRTILNMILDRTKDEKTKALILERLSGAASTPSKPKAEKSLDIDDDIHFKSSNDLPFEEEELVKTNVSASDEDDDDEYDSLFKNL
jgi:hypothetical protein